MYLIRLFYSINPNINTSHLLDRVRRSVELDGVLHHAGELAGGGAEARNVGLAAPGRAGGRQGRATGATTLCTIKHE